MLRKSVLELSSRLSTKRFPRNLGTQRFHLSSTRKVSTSGKNGLPVGKPDASKVTPPVGKPDGLKVSSAIMLLGGAAAVTAFVVAYRSGGLDEYLGKEQQKLSERIHSDDVPKKLEEAHHLNVEDSTEKDGIVETQPEVTHSEASGGTQSDKQVQPDSDLTPGRFTYISSNQEETPQESAIDTVETSLSTSSDDNSTSEEDLITKSAMPEAESVSLEAVPKPGDSSIVSVQPSSGQKESETESASPKDPAIEKAPKDDIELEVQIPGSLLKEYNLEGSDTESTGSQSIGEQLTKETKALPSSIEGLKDGYMTEDGKLVLDFLGAIHAAEKRQAHLDAQIFAEELRALKEKYENELRDLRARELMRIEEAAILDKELKRERTKAATAIKAIQERMEDKLKTEIEQKETEAQLSLSKAEELAKAEMISAIAKEKAAQIEKMAEADLNIKALCMAFYARSEEARQSHSVHKLAVGALALDDALSKGLPIEKEINALQTYLEGINKDSILDLVVSSLPEEARSNGTDTVLQLNQKFNTLKGTLRHFSLIPPGGGGMLAHSLAQIASWLKFKEVDQANGGIESVIKKVDNYLAEGKLAEAAATLEEGVKGSKAEEIVSDWVRRARNRAITEQALTLLQSYATCLSHT
ncbi:MICOS complex subunit MIC60 [Cardamine amara subsp. amara]|uniref:MICOS complex subunit MIC60 n=1 Tax=Cardamine amara subsp. amara TaxID=228776 RepID=A0ABD0Z6Q3_CARAN